MRSAPTPHTTMNLRAARYRGKPVLTWWEGKATSGLGTGTHVILDDSGRVIGRVSLNGIVRGAFQSCALSYWVSAGHNGRGFATKAVCALVRVAFEELRLHRVQAETLLHNAGSQRVLERNGFVRYGMAPEYLNIAGRWQDHAMYQMVKPSPATD